MIYSIYSRGYKYLAGIAKSTVYRTVLKLKNEQLVERKTLPTDRTFHTLNLR